jgi:hypothetical protein
MGDTLHSRSERALILAPHGRDAAVAADILHAAAIAAEICPDLPALVREIAQGAGFALVTDEAFRTANLKELSRGLTSPSCCSRVAAAGLSAIQPWRVCLRFSAM